MNRIRKLLVVITSIMLLSSSFSVLLLNLTSPQTVSAVVENNSPSLMSLGASLDNQQIERTQQLLGAQDVASQNIIRVDGVMVNHYLNDGSNANTGVYSSAYIKPQAPNYGVQVQIVTPQNITSVSPSTYQNAAITAGAKDVLVRVATVVPVTGEGALAGVYALLEESGVTLNPKDIQVANQEITLINEIHNNVTINNYTVNKLITNIKVQIIEQKNINVNLTADDINIIVINVLQNYDIDAQLNNELLQKLLDYAMQFSETDAANNPETVEQLELSIIGNNWAEILANQEGSMSFEEALSLERPDYSNTETYHPIIQAMLNKVYERFENEEYTGEIYSHTFIVESLIPTLSTEELEALNYIRTLIYQVQAGSEDEAVKPIKTQWLLALNRDPQLRLEPALYEMIQRISYVNGYASEALTYQDWFQDENYFIVTVVNDWTASQQILGHYALDMTTMQVYNYDLPAGRVFESEFLPTIDFESLYGVQVEFQEFEAPLTEDYDVPEESIYLEENDEPFIENLPEESAEESTESDETEQSIEESNEQSAEESTDDPELESEEEPLDEESEQIEESSSELASEISEVTDESISEVISSEESEEVNETITMPDFNQSWREVLEDSEVEVVMTTEQITQLDLSAYNDSTTYHPIIPAMYTELMNLMASQREPQLLMSHSFIYEDMTPNISNEERAALNQLRWLVFQYFLNDFQDKRTPEFNQHSLNYRDELIRRVEVLNQLNQDPNMKEIYAMVSQSSGLSGLAYAIETELTEIEGQILQVFYFWLDGYPPTEYPAYYYNFTEGIVGNLGLGNYLETINAFDFYDYYGVEVINQYQASAPIQLTTEAQQLMELLETNRQAEEEPSKIESIEQDMTDESIESVEDFVDDFTNGDPSSEEFEVNFEEGVDEEVE